MPKLDKEGCKITIEGEKLIITKDDKTIMIGHLKDELYRVGLDETEHALLADAKPRNRNALLGRIHNQTGHRNLLRIRKYVREGKLRIKDFPKDVTERELKALPACDACNRAKFTKKRLRRIQVTPLTIGLKIYTDMKDPFRITGIHGERYYQGFIDGYTKFLKHCFFQYKSEALDNLVRVLQKSPFFGNTQHYHADGAPELISKETVKILQEKGIRMTFSAP